jgi:hypothetical protein
VSDPASTDLFGTIHQLVLERALGQITAERFDELDRLLGASAEARMLYVQYIQETVGLQSMLGRDGNLPIPQFTAGDTTWLTSPPARTGRTRRLFGRLLHTGSAATWAAVAVVGGLVITASVIIGFVIHGVISHRRGSDVAKTPEGSGAGAHELRFAKPGLPVAHLAGTADCRWGQGGAPLEAGAGIEPGRTIVLESGLAEMVFRDGAKGILAGPATMQFGSAKSVFLRRGRFTAIVEDTAARGFEVLTPGMRYTDLGTEFGVFVGRDGVQEMHVFRGRVTADEFRAGEGEGEFDGAKGPDQVMSSRDSSGPLPQSPSHAENQQPAALAGRHITLTASQAIRVGGPEKPFERIAADEKGFVRAMPPLEPFVLFSTGVGLDRGAADSHWEIVALSTEPAFKPRPAVVADPEPDYCADARDKAQWVSLSKSLPDLPGRCKMTFRTKFDLTGYDPATARIEGYCATDDWPVEMRLNGHASVPLPPEKRTLTLPVVPLVIEKGFVAGENVLEIVVENAVVPKMPLNHMALFVHWKGTARKSAVGK